MTDTKPALPLELELLREQSVRWREYVTDYNKTRAYYMGKAHEKGFSMAAIADAAGISKQRVSQILAENGGDGE